MVRSSMSAAHLLSSLMPNQCNITKLREVEKAESRLQTCNNKT